MASKKELTDVDTNFVQSYHIGKEMWELLHIFWAQILPSSGGRKSYEGSRLIVLTQMRLLVVRSKTFGAKRIAERAFLLTCLTNARIRFLHSFFELTLFFKDEELIIVTNSKEDCEKVTIGLMRVVARLKQVIPFYKEPQIDCSLELPKPENKRLSNVENIRFSYVLHCALAHISQQDSITKNLIAAVESGKKTFEPFEMLDGARDRKNDINVIVNSIHSVSCFETLKVSGRTIRPDTLREMGKLVLTNSNIIDVEFPGCRLSKDLFSFFTKPFEEASKFPVKRPPIRLLNLLKNPLGNVGDCLVSLGSVEVDSLILADCRINKKAITSGLLPLFMRENWLSEGGLRVINLGLNELGKKGSQDLIPFLKNTRGLEELGLTATQAELHIILQTIQKNKVLSLSKLAVLNLSKNKMTPFAAVALGEILEESQSIRHVNLRDTALDEDTLEHIISKISKNKTGAEIELDVSNNRMGTFADSVFRSLRDIGNGLVGLTMSNCSLGDCRDFSAIASRLSTASNLKLLNLDLNFRVNKKALNEEKIQALADCVQELKSLEILSLMGEKPHRKMALQGVELVPLLNILPKNKSLKVLNLLGNRLNDEGSKALAVGLSANTTLTNLEIEENKLNFENLKIIVQSIDASSGLWGTLPRETMNRLYHEKKRHREPVKAWGMRLSRIFEDNFRKEQEEVLGEEECLSDSNDVKNEADLCKPVVVITKEDESRAGRKTASSFRNRRASSSIGCRSYVDNAVLMGSYTEVKQGDIEREFTLKNIFKPSTSGYLETCDAETGDGEEKASHRQAGEEEVEGIPARRVHSYEGRGTDIDGKALVPNEHLLGVSPITSSFGHNKNYSSHMVSFNEPVKRLQPTIPAVQEDMEGERIGEQDLYPSSKKNVQAVNISKNNSGIALLLKNLSTSEAEHTLVEGDEPMKENIAAWHTSTEIKETEHITKGEDVRISACSPVTPGESRRGSHQPSDNSIAHPAPPPLPTNQVAASPKVIKGLRASASPGVVRNKMQKQGRAKSPPRTEHVSLTKSEEKALQSGKIVTPKKRQKRKKKVFARAAQFEGVGLMGMQKKRPRAARGKVSKLNDKRLNVMVMGVRSQSTSVLGSTSSDSGIRNSKYEDDEKIDLEKKNKVDVSQMIVSRARIGEGRKVRDRQRRRKKTRRPRTIDL